MFLNHNQNCLAQFCKTAASAFWQMGQFLRSVSGHEFGSCHMGCDRKSEVILTRLRTGHLQLNAYLCRFNMCITDEWNFCEVPEYVEHYLMHCHNIVHPDLSFMTDTIAWALRSCLLGWFLVVSIVEETLTSGKYISLFLISILNIYTWNLTNYLTVKCTIFCSLSDNVNCHSRLYWPQ